MGLLGGIARTAVAAGTWTAVSNRVSRRQSNRWSEQQQQQAYAAQQTQAYQQPPRRRHRPPPAATGSRSSRTSLTSRPRGS